MTEEKQWFWTKVVGSLLGLTVLISTAVGASNLVTSLRRDIDRNERTLSEHELMDEKKWDRIFSYTEDNRSSIQEIEKKGERTDTKLEYIIKGIDDLKKDMARLERADG